VLELIYEEIGDPADGWLPGAADLDAAVELGRRHADVDAVFSSDLGRALETVAVAFGSSEVPVFYDWRLRECNLGAMNGAPVGELEVEKHVDVPFPGGESYRDVAVRVDSFLEDLRARWDGKGVLVVSHAAPRWALQHLVDGTPLEELVGAPFDRRPGWTFRI